MKKLLIILMALGLLVSFVGCKQTEVSDPTTIQATPGATKPTDDTQSTSDVEPDGDATLPSDPSDDNTVTDEPGVITEKNEFVRVLDYIPRAKQNLAYAGYGNFTGQLIYPFKDAYLRYGTVKKLAEVAAELEEKGFGLLIWDAYRPVYAQKKLFEAFPDPSYVSPPGVGNQNHCRGKAVDLTLYDLKTGAELLMPTEFDDFTVYADRDYSDVSPEAAANAKLLEEVMQKHGFEGYSAEWWHFNDTENYPVEESFDPATVQ